MGNKHFTAVLVAIIAALVFLVMSGKSGDKKQVGEVTKTNKEIASDSEVSADSSDDKSVKSADKGKKYSNKSKADDKNQSDSGENDSKARTYDATALEIPKLEKTTNCPSQILVREGYTTSYNKRTRNANWVAWHLTKAHTDGKWERGGISYMVDEDVKGARQELEDWKNSGLPIDHGHLCPAGDCKWSKKAMWQSFLLTNMSPQNSALNRGDWQELESRCRGWASHYGDIYIVAGPIFPKRNIQTIGENKIGVPEAFYKVVLCMKGKNSPKALGFIYKNEGTHHKISEYVTTVDEVEKKTKIDFFYNLPDDVENKVEAVAEIEKW